MNSTISRDFRFSDAILKQKGDSFRDMLVRDMADFAVFGISDASVIEGLISDFDAQMPLSYFRGKVSIARQNRRAARKALMQRLRTLRAMTKAYWGGNAEANYRIYDWARLNLDNENRLMNRAKSAHQIATQQLAQLSNQGMNQQFLDSLETDRIALSNKIDEYKASVRQRDLATQQRIVKGNALYAEIVRLSDFGKNIYAFTNEAKHNDYRIYNPTPRKAPKPTPATGSGLVTDQSNGTPLNGATIFFIKTTDNTTAYTTQTDSQGRYSETRVTPGSYSLRISMNGFITHQSPAMSYQTGQTLIHNVALMPQGP